MQKNISSLQNPFIKQLLLLQEKARERKKIGMFTVEGEREISLAVKGGYEIISLIYCNEIYSENALMHLIGAPIERIEVPMEIYQKIAYRETTEGIIALVKAKNHNLDSLSFENKNPLILIAEAPEKPGNIGALLRTADAAKLDAVLIANPKTDLYNPNIVRSSVGGLFTNRIATSVDDDEIGSIIPHVRSLIAYNAESKIVESMRPNGVLIGQIVPRGGRITGTSSVVQFDAWNWEDAAIKIDDAIHMNWPNSFTRGRWWLGESRAYSPNKNYAEDIEKVRSFLADAVAYGKATPQDKNLVFQSVQRLFYGEQKLFISANGEKEIIDAITFAKEMGVKEIVLVGGYDAYKITEFLKQHNVAVLAARTQSTPNSDDDDYDLPYKMPKILADAGILVALDPDGRMERMNTRNLPFYAGQVVGQGMDKEEALKMITSNAAKILGIDKDYGTLEIGKSATLFISEGDALDVRTNKLTKAYIDGRDISLEMHHTTLYKRYSEKYNAQEE